MWKGMWTWPSTSFIRPPNVLTLHDRHLTKENNVVFLEFVIKEDKSILNYALNINIYLERNTGKSPSNAITANNFHAYIIIYNTLKNRHFKLSHDRLRLYIRLIIYLTRNMLSIIKMHYFFTQNLYFLSPFKTLFLIIFRKKYVIYRMDR